MPSKARPKRVKPQVLIPHGSYDRYYDSAAMPHAGAFFNPGRTERWRTRANQLRHPQPNGRLDIITYMIIIDALMRVDTKLELTARRMYELLLEDCPTIMWDVVTVGQILTSIADNCAAFVPQEYGLRPINLSGDAHRYYTIVQTPSNWRWMGDLLDAIGAEANRLIRLERKNQELYGREFELVTIAQNVPYEHAPLVEPARKIGT